MGLIDVVMILLENFKFLSAINYFWVIFNVFFSKSLSLIRWQPIDMMIFFHPSLLMDFLDKRNLKFDIFQEEINFTRPRPTIVLKKCNIFSIGSNNIEDRMEKHNKWPYSLLMCMFHFWVQIESDTVEKNKTFCSIFRP